MAVYTDWNIVLPRGSRGNLSYQLKPDTMVFIPESTSKLGIDSGKWFYISDLDPDGLCHVAEFTLSVRGNEVTVKDMTFHAESLIDGNLAFMGEYTRIIDGYMVSYKESADRNFNTHRILPTSNGRSAWHWDSVVAVIEDHLAPEMEKRNMERLVVESAEARRRWFKYNRLG